MEREQPTAPVTNDAKTRAALALARAAQDYAAELVTILDELLRPEQDRADADLPPFGTDDPGDSDECPHDWVIAPGETLATCTLCGARDGLVQA
jgi:hypothetical protein